MRFLVVLVAMVVGAAAAPAGAHEWYSGLRSPSGTPCCNDRDCRAVEYRVNPDTGNEEIRANGTWHPVEYDKVLPIFPPDGGSHACWNNSIGKPRFRCIMLPGMAALDPPAGDGPIHHHAGRDQPPGDEAEVRPLAG